MTSRLLGGRPVSPGVRRPSSNGTSWGPRPRDDRGSGTVLVMTATGLLVGLATVWVIAGGYFLGWRQAATSADLAALSAATAANVSGSALEAAPSGGILEKERRALCEVASQTARANGTTLESCSVRGAPPSLVVAVAVSVRFTPAWVGLPSRGSARAWASSAELG